MKLKTLIVSVAVLGLVSAVVFFVRRPAAPPSADARLNQPLVDQATVEKAAKLRISDQGKTVTLARQADGTWRVPDYHGLPADFSKLSNLVGTLTDARLQRLVTSNPERIARLEFKDTKIEFLDAGDKPLWSATLGKMADAGGRYVRFGDEQKAYLADLRVWIDPDAKNWANSELLNVKADDVAKIEIPFAEGGPITLSRVKKEDAWSADKTPAGQQVNATKVSTVLGTIGNLRFSDTSAVDDDNAVAAKANPRTLTLTTFDQRTITIALGRKPEEKKLKPPAPVADGKSGPAALGNLTDLAKAGEKKEGDAKSADAKPEEAKPLAPEYETIPAGPVYAFITHSDSAAPVNTLMKQRAFQVSDYTFTGLPQKPEDMFEPAPALSRPTGAAPATGGEPAPKQP